MIGAYNPNGELLRQGNLGIIKQFLENLHPNARWHYDTYNDKKAFWRVDVDGTPRGYMYKVEETAKVNV